MIMLPRIVLLVLQLAAGWFVVPQLKVSLQGFVPPGYDLLFLAVLYAVVIMVVGFIGSVVMKGLPIPSSGTFIVMLILACAIAAVVKWAPQYLQTVEDPVPLLRSNRALYPFAAALLGYYLKK
jgi:hypothetical protein